MISQPKTAGSAKIAISFITGGALLAVWSMVYFFYHRERPGDLPGMYNTGFFLTGLIFVVVGLLVGQIGRSALQSEVVAPPTQVITPAATEVVAPQAPPQVAPSPAQPVVGMPINPRRQMI